MEKEALAVFNPQNPIEEGVQDAYHAVFGRYLTMGETHLAIKALLGCHGIAEYLKAHAYSTAGMIFSKDTQTNYITIPCHQIELRDILRERKIVSPKLIAGFTGASAKRLLQDYDILLVLDPHRLQKPILNLETFKVYGNSLDIDNAVVRILTRERLDSLNAASAMRIVKEEYPETEVYPIAQPPGMAVPKVAGMFDGLHKFIVDIPTLEIKSEPHNAHNAEEAVQTALNEKWQRQGIAHKDPKFTAQYWKSSGFWNEIVWPADEKEVMTMAAVKTAELSTLGASTDHQARIAWAYQVIASQVK